MGSIDDSTVRKSITTPQIEDLRGELKSSQLLSAESPDFADSLKRWSLAAVRPAVSSNFCLFFIYQPQFSFPTSLSLKVRVCRNMASTTGSDALYSLRALFYSPSPSMTSPRRSPTAAKTTSTSPCGAGAIRRPAPPRPMAGWSSTSVRCAR